MINIQNDHLKVQVKPKGAELSSVISNDTQLEYMWCGDPAIWGKTSPVLFPFVGTLKEDAFIFRDRKFKMTRHGFARDQIFKVELQQVNSVVFLLESSQASLSNYPFHFQLRLKYGLVKNELQVTYELRNTGSEDIYFSIGGHPAFNVPLVRESRYEDHYLEFNKMENAGRWPISAEGLIEETPNKFFNHTNKLDLTKSLFENDALVFKHLQSNIVSLKSRTHTHGLDFDFTGFKFLGIWAAKHANFVCIEPWCGIADSVLHNQELTNKEGIEKVKFNEVWERAWSVRFY